MELERMEKLLVSLKNLGQEHLLTFWDRLDDEHRDLLYKDIMHTDLAQVNKYFIQCMADTEKVGQKVDDHLQPLPAETLGSVVRTDLKKLKKYEEIGLKQVAAGKVAVVLMAGGQGTRLGVGYPKGMYDVGLPSHKSLYQLQGERIVKLVQNAEKLTGVKGRVPWYIMTSEHTKASTEAFFQKHDYFGLDPNDVSLFEQQMLPCLDFNGKVILEAPHKLARAPNGNGGLYSALQNSKTLDDLDRRGIEYIHCYCVDNILVKMADPVFTGFCISKKACCGTKVVEKSIPTEAVGVVCKVDDHYQVVEYSEITLNTAERRNTDGRLMFNAGSICNHFFTLDFLKQVCTKCESDLVHHVAKKKILYTNNNMQTVKPDVNNGIKMEKFVFDVFRFARDSNFAVWEVLREDEFSPLKNGNNAPKDTPTTSRYALYNLHKRQVLKAGGAFVRQDGTMIPQIARNHLNGLNGSATNGHKNGTNGTSNGRYNGTSALNGTHHRSNGTINSSTNGLPSHTEDDDDETIICEISPLVSSTGEGLAELVLGKKFIPPLVLKKQGESHNDSVSTLD